MEYKINDAERDALRGLPHLQCLLYYTGIRPYMDCVTRIVGIKRGISYQSLAEELYVEPHVGYQSGSPSRDQIRRAIVGLEKAGLLQINNQTRKLIFKCLLATQGYCAQNKAATKPPYQATTKPHNNSIELSEHYQNYPTETTIDSGGQAAPPLINKINNKNNNNHTRENFFDIGKKIDPNFSPSPEILERAQKLDCANQHSAESVLRFILHHQSRGTKSFHWDAEYLRWILNGKTYADKQEQQHERSRNENHWPTKSNRKRGRSAIERVMDAHSEFLKRSGRIIELTDED